MPIRTERVIYARRTQNGRHQVAVNRIGAPEWDDGSWRCRVHCPAALSCDTWIFGVDAAQARHLAAKFVATMLDHHGWPAPRIYRNLWQRAIEWRPAAR